MLQTTPFDAVLDRLFTLDRAMDQVFATRPGPGTADRNGGSGPLWLPALDTYETENAFVVEADLPGVQPDGVEISFERNTLTIKGSRPAPLQAPKHGELRVYNAERVSGAFARAIRLPEYVEGDKIEAHFANGVLTVTIPKAPSALPRRITISAAGSDARRLNA